VFDKNKTKFNYQEQVDMLFWKIP